MNFDEMFKKSKRLGSYEIFKSENNEEFYFRLKASNGEIILKSEGYTTKQNCLNGIESVKENGYHTENYYISKSTDKQYYFEIKSDNNETIGVSEMYKNLNILLISIYSVIRNCQTEIITEV